MLFLSFDVATRLLKMGLNKWLRGMLGWEKQRQMNDG